jgi:hypothetical protein
LVRTKSSIAGNYHDAVDQNLRLWTFNTTLFSTWVGAINTGLIFLIFRKASQKG